MTRKRFRHLMMELHRRILMSQWRYSGFGKVAKGWDRNWRMTCHPGELGGYKAIWESKELKPLRDSVGM